MELIAQVAWFLGSCIGAAEVLIAYSDTRMEDARNVLSLVPHHQNLLLSQNTDAGALFERVLDETRRGWRNHVSTIHPDLRDLALDDAAVHVMDCNEQLG